MKQYVCGICGYIHDEAVGGKWEDLPADWKCPVCKAGKDAFKPKEEKKQRHRRAFEKPHVDKELSPHGNEHHLLQSGPWLRKAVSAPAGR